MKNVITKLSQKDEINWYMCRKVVYILSYRHWYSTCTVNVGFLGIGTVNLQYV